MEFRFDLKPIFSQPIVKVGANLLPHTFRGDRRTALDVSTKMQEIINTVGEHSARAQGLTKAVTTAQKIRQSENQNIYLLVDVDDGKRGSVIGMLKIGKKSLYVFDQTGTTQMVEAQCILDFYIHESRQRAGLGKDLFETMLEHEHLDPRKLAIDRPSDKLLGFLKKHYGLEKTIPQMNNFVIFDGFFDHTENGNVIHNHNYNNQVIKVDSSPNTALFGPLISSDERFRRSRAENTASYNPLTGVQNNPIGRYAAHRPTCSMAETKSNQNMKSSLSQISAVRNYASQLNDQNPRHNNKAKSILNKRSVCDIGGGKRSGLQDIDIGTYNKVQYGNCFNFRNPQFSSSTDSKGSRLHMEKQTVSQFETPNITPEEMIRHQSMPSQIHNQRTCQNQLFQQQQLSQRPIPVQSMSQLPQNCQIPFYHHTIPPYQLVAPENNSYSHIENFPQQIQCQQVQPPQIIHSTAVQKSTGEPNSHAPSNDDEHSEATVLHDLEATRASFEQLETSDLVTEPDENPELEPEPEAEQEQEHDGEHHDLTDDIAPSECGTTNDAAGTPTSQIDFTKRQSLVNDRYRGNKQHTGMKNMSYGVGAAVTPTTKMEFYNEQSGDFGILKINQPAGKSHHSNEDNASVISSVTSGDGFTEHGYYDLKFHHNKLW